MSGEHGCGALFAILFLSGCFPSPADYAHRGCDATHACFDGRACVANLCADPSAGGTTPGTDAGCVTWRQARDGLSSPSHCASCSLVIDSAAQNTLTATITGSGASNDFAAAHVPPAQLFAANEGHLRGLFSHPDASRLGAPSTFLRISTSSGTLLDLTVSNNWELGAFTSAGVLQATPLNSTGGPRLDLTQPYLIDVSWRQGAFRTISVDGTPAFSDTLAPYSGSNAAPTDLLLGIIDYAGSETQGWTAKLASWQLCRTADGTF